MHKINKKLKQILYPNTFLFILFFILGFGSVITVFICRLETTVVGYISYVLSAYALLITVFRSINLIKKINKKIYENKYTNKLLTDKEFKNNLSIYSGTVFNMIFGAFKIIAGIIYKSIWFESVGVYYIILGVIKLSLSTHIIKRLQRNNSLYSRELQEF